MTGASLEGIDRLDKIEQRTNIPIYPDLCALEEIYSHYCDISLKSNELVLILTYYQTAECIWQTLKELDMDVEKYEKENDLIILEDSIEKHSGYTKDFLSLLKLLINYKRNEVKMDYLLLQIRVYFFIFKIVNMP